MRNLRLSTTKTRPISNTTAAPVVAAARSAPGRSQAGPPPRASKKSTSVTKKAPAAQAPKAKPKRQSRRNADMLNLIDVRAIIESLGGQGMVEGGHRTRSSTAGLRAAIKKVVDCNCGGPQHN